MTFLVLWGPVLFLMGLIFFFSSLSDPGAPPGGVSDKVAHFGVYAALGGALVRALAGGRSRAMTGRVVALAAILGTIYGVSDEVHQYFVPPRTPDWRDVAADAGGALAGAFAVALVARAIARRRAPGPVRR